MKIYLFSINRFGISLGREADRRQPPEDLYIIATSMVKATEVFLQTVKVNVGALSVTEIGPVAATEKESA